MNQIVKQNGALDPAIIESLVLGGDVGKLSPAQKVQYVAYRCKQVGLDPAAQPFQLLRLQGKEVLYATAGATQQLCQTRGLSVSITKREKVEDIYCVEARVTDKEGRFSENMGSTPIAGLKGEALSNALLKATTKAIRRTVLAHCGLGLLDETEAETIPGAQMQGRGNPLRHEFAALSFELDACKSQEQIDLLFDSPEFKDFEERDSKQPSGMSFAGMMRDKAEQMRKKLPERIRFEGNRIVAATHVEAEIAAEARNGGREPDVAPGDGSSTTPPASNSEILEPDESEISPGEKKEMDYIASVDSADSVPEVQKVRRSIEQDKDVLGEKRYASLKRVCVARVKEIETGDKLVA